MYVLKRCFLSKVVAKQDHKTAVLLLSLGHQTRHTEEGAKPSFTGQIKVRKGLIGVLYLKEKRPLPDFHSQIISVFASGNKCAAYLHFLCIQDPRRAKAK